MTVFETEFVLQGFITTLQVYDLNEIDWFVLLVEISNKWRRIGAE